MNFDTFWTEDAVARMQTLVVEGLSAGKIAAQLTAEFDRSISRNAVIGKIARLARQDARAAVLAAAPKVRFDTSNKTPRALLAPVKSGSDDGARPRHGGGEGHVPAVSVNRRRRELDQRPRRDTEAIERTAFLALAAEPGEPRRLRLADLGRTDCKFPLDGPTGEHQLFCALPAYGSSAYCAHHHHRCYTPREKRTA